MLFLRFDQISPAISNTLKRVIDTVYDDGVDEILEVAPTGSSGIAGKFRDGEKVMDFAYKDGRLSFNEARNDHFDSYLRDRLDSADNPYWEAYFVTRLDAPKGGGGKKRNCTKGKSCGGSCIAAGKECRQKVAGAANVAAEAAEAAIRKEVGTAITLHSSAKRLQPKAKAETISPPSKMKTRDQVQKEANSASSGSMPSAKQIMSKDGYAALGLDGTKATTEEVKKRYRDLSRIYHPDNKETGNRDIFEKVNNAYQTATENFEWMGPAKRSSGRGKKKKT